MSEAQTERPIIRMVPSPPAEGGGGQNLTIVFDVDLVTEHAEYLQYIHHQPPEDQRPFLDEMSFIARQIMEGYMIDGAIDSQGWGLTLRKGRVIVNDVCAVAIVDRCAPQDDEPF